jgi:hypothetical protein
MGISQAWQTMAAAAQMSDWGSSARFRKKVRRKAARRFGRALIAEQLA